MPYESLKCINGVSDIEIIGRLKYIDKLKAKIKARQHKKIVTITGFSGVGKTTLARHLSFNLSWNGPDQWFRAVLWQSVSSSDKTPQDLLVELAQLIQPEYTNKLNYSLENTAREVRKLLTNYVSEHCRCECNSTLIVLDDVWENNVEHIKWIREACPDDSTILITTRNRNLSFTIDEYSLDTETIDIEDIELEGLSLDEGVELFLKELKLTRDTIPIETLSLLVELLNYNSLAIVRVAKLIIHYIRVERVSINEAIEYYYDYYSRMFPKTNFKIKNDKYTSKVFDKIFSQIVETLDVSPKTGKTREYFIVLGLLAFDKPFTKTLLQKFWELEEAEFKRVYRRLAQFYLLEEDVASSTFRIYQLAQAYAKEQLGGLGSELVKLYNVRYQEFVITILSKLNKQAAGNWNKWSLEIPHIEEIKTQFEKIPNLDSLEMQDLDRMLKFAVEVQRYLEQRYRFDERFSWLNKGLEISQKTQDKIRTAFFHLHLAEFYRDNSGGEEITEEQRKEQIEENYNVALELYQAENDIGGQAIVLADQAYYYRFFYPGGLKGIMSKAQAAYSLLEQIAVLEDRSTLLIKLGEILRDFGEVINASSISSSRSRNRRNDKDQRVQEDNSAQVVDRFPDAYDFYLQALASCHETGEDAKKLDIYKVLSEISENRHGSDLAYDGLTEISEGLHNYELAFEYFTKYLKLAGDSASLEDYSRKDNLEKKIARLQSNLEYLKLDDTTSQMQRANVIMTYILALLNVNEGRTAEEEFREKARELFEKDLSSLARAGNLLLEYDLRRRMLSEYLALAKKIEADVRKRIESQFVNVDPEIIEEEGYFDSLSFFEKAIEQVLQCKELRQMILAKEVANDQ